MQSCNSNKCVINVEDVHLLFERVHNFYWHFLSWCKICVSSFILYSGFQALHCVGITLVPIYKLAVQRASHKGVWWRNIGKSWRQQVLRNGTNTENVSVSSIISHHVTTVSTSLPRLNLWQPGFCFTAGNMIVTRQRTCLVYCQYCVF